MKFILYKNAKHLRVEGIGESIRRRLSEFVARNRRSFGYGATKSVAYNMGADVLYNIIDNTNKIFGVFASVAIGGETWVANGKDYKPNGGKGEAYGNFQTILTINATKTTMRRPYALSLAYTYNF